MQVNSRLHLRTSAVALLSLAFAAGPSLAGISVQGLVRVWNPINQTYEPLKQAKVRVVLGENVDWDTLDESAATNADGMFAAGKGDPWYGDTYDVYIIVYAEVPNKLEVQEYYLQYDGYQAVSPEVTVHNGESKTFYMEIGGPNENDVHHYQAGGIGIIEPAAHLGGEHLGWQAFFICLEMTDHRWFLVQHRAWKEANFEEKEVSFPAGDGAVRKRYWDYIQIPEDEFPADPLDASKWKEFRASSHTLRHELSHGIMADEFWVMPDGLDEDHYYNEPVAHHDGAWLEGWADFLPEVSLEPRYGTDDEAIEESPELAAEDLQSDARARTESEVCRAMWDIYDGIGWEKRARQYETEIPGVEVFWDGIEDPLLVRVEDIFADDRPTAFTEGDWNGDDDSFVRYWLGRSSYGQRHELKAILFNRGMDATDYFQQHNPQVVLGLIDYSTGTLKIPVTVTEQDEEDRPFVTIDIFLDDRKCQTHWVEGEDWQGSTKTVTVEQDVAWMVGQPPPKLLVAVNDNIESAWVERMLDTDKLRPIGAVKVEAVGVNVVRTTTPDFGAEWWPTHVPPLEKLFVHLEHREGNVSKHMRYPANGDWTVNEKTFTFEQVEELWKTTAVPESVTVDVDWLCDQRLALNGGGVSRMMGNTTIEIKREDDFQFGEDHAVTLVDKTATLDGDVPIRTEVQVVLRTSPIYQRRPRDIPRPGTIRPGRPGIGGIVAGATRPGIPSGTIRPGGTDSVRPMTLSRMISKAGQLIDEYGQVQEEAASMAAELEYKLDPSHGPPTEEAEATPSPGGIRAPRRMVLRRPGVGVQEGVVMLAPASFLETASSAQFQIPELTGDQLAYLQTLREGITEREDRLPQIGALAQDLRRQIDTAITKLNAKPELDQTARLRMERTLTTTSARLAALQPTFASSQELLAKERMVIDKVLQAPPAGANMVTQPPEGGIGGSPDRPRPGADPGRRPAAGAAQGPREFDGWTLTGEAEGVRGDRGVVIGFPGPGRAVGATLHYHNMRLHLRYRHGDGRAQIGLLLPTGKGEGQAPYHVRFTGGRIGITRSGGGSNRTLASGTHPCQPGEWCDIIVDLVRGRLKVSVDGREVLAAEDEEPIRESGHLTLECVEGSGFAFEGMRVTRL